MYGYEVVVKSGHDVLTVLYAYRNQNFDVRHNVLQQYRTKILREAADLCGVDATDMPRRAAILAILNNF